MVKIYIKNCNLCEMDLSAKEGLKLYNEFSIRHPSAFYLRGKVKGWDGIVHFINKGAQFKIGLLPSVVQACKQFNFEYKVVDMRRTLKVPKKPITGIGKYKLRPEQIKAVSSILYNKVEDIPFHIGVIDYTVNAGKSLIMSALYLSFQKKLKTLLITNDSDWFNQAKDEFPQYLPGEKITFIQGSKVFGWENFSIGMIQSISRNIKKYQKDLTQVDMVLVDEADLAGSKQYQNVLTHLYNTQVRIGLSGTIYMSKLSKDRLKNMNLRSFFGDVLAGFTLKQSIKKGYSTNTIVKIVNTKPWFGNWESYERVYAEVYKDTITQNESAYKVVLDRLKYNLRYGRIPALVVCKFIEHCENIYKYLRDALEKHYKIACVHVNTNTKVRRQIMKDFREGKIDILVSTTIIARGKNFPLLKYMINAADMDSQEKNIQFLGRLVRTHEGKDKAYLDDIWYPGNYLDRHGRHRKVYYQKQNLKVIILGRKKVRDMSISDPS